MDISWLLSWLDFSITILNGFVFLLNNLDHNIEKMKYDISESIDQINF